MLLVPLLLAADAARSRAATDGGARRERGLFRSLNGEPVADAQLEQRAQDWPDKRSRVRIEGTTTAPYPASAA